MKRKEDVRRMKALKMKELRSKLERIGKYGGKDLETDQGEKFGFSY
jgi:protein KRI1